VSTELAGPSGSLISLVSEADGQRTRVSVIRTGRGPGLPPALLYTQLVDVPFGTEAVEISSVFANTADRAVLLWPTGSAGRAHVFDPAGWVSGDALHPLPGVGRVFPQGIAW
jgi:hypothetical protein